MEGNETEHSDGDRKWLWVDWLIREDLSVEIIFELRSKW